MCKFKVRFYFWQDRLYLIIKLLGACVVTLFVFAVIESFYNLFVFGKLEIFLCIYDVEIACICENNIGEIVIILGEKLTEVVKDRFIKGFAFKKLLSL